MAKKNFYAWIAPGGAGIHETWEECQAACSGFKHERHKGFATYEEAWHFAYPDKPFPKPADETPTVAPADEQADIISREDEVNSPSQPIVPFTSTEIPVSEEVNQYCSKYGFEKLSYRQRMAVQSVDGKTLLFAVPGSGKTTVIVARTGFMVYSRKIDPNSIISLTFTKAAANEMVTRYKDHFKTENVPDFRTIHSLCYSIILPRLRRSGYCCPPHLLGIEDGLEDEEKPRTPTAVYRALFKAIKHQPADFETAMESIQCVITGIKNSVMHQSEYEHKYIKIDGVELSVSLLFNTYQQIMRDLECMDFDDLLIHAFKGLKSYPNVLRSLRQKYTYWSVDEAQDTSKLQFKLLDLLCGPDGNVFMVGDDDQSIYSFRGANPRLLLDFGHRAGVTTLLMGYNYRSDHEIVSASKSFIESNQNRAEKEMLAFSPYPGYIHIPQAFRTEVGQYEFIVQAAKEAVSRNDTLAVLYRRNISCLPLIVYLHRNGIPYEANKGIAEILRSKNIKGIWRVFLFLVSPNSFSAFSSCHTYLNLYLKKEELEDLKETHTRNSKIPVLELLLRKYEESDNPEKATDVKDLIKSISRIREMRPTAAAKTVLSDLFFWSPETISDRLRIYSFLSACDLFGSVSDFVKCIKEIISEEKKKAETPDPTDFDNSLAAVTTTLKPVVTLSSMHSAKGREFDRVIIVDSFDEIMPGEERDDALIYDPEEELRLFYVAVTRAEHRLDLLTVDKYHGNTETISRFISAFAYICEQNCDNVSILESVPESMDVQSGTIKIEPTKYYAVKRGRKPGIYTTWSDCQSQIHGFSGADYKSFSTREEAEAYLGSVSIPLQEITSLRTIEPNIIGSEGVAFNYPMDIPAIVCESVHSHFGVSSLEQLDSETLAHLRSQSNNMFGAGQTASYHSSAEAYLLTYMPVNFFKIWKPLYDLANAGDLQNVCRVLELGAGPGTATMGLISFFSELASSNPEIPFRLDITAVEKENRFRPLFENLTGRLSNVCPSNLSIECKLIEADALGAVPEYDQLYDLIVESNMLNQAEGLDAQAIESFAHVLSKTVGDQGTVIMIEPGTKDDRTFLKRLEMFICGEKIADQVIPPKTLAVNVSGISLYHEAVSAGLRGARKSEHWFSYLVMRKGADLF